MSVSMHVTVFCMHCIIAHVGVYRVIMTFDLAVTWLVALWFRWLTETIQVAVGLPGDYLLTVCNSYIQRGRQPMGQFSLGWYRQ